MKELREYVDYLSNILKIKPIPLKIVSTKQMQKISRNNTLAAYDQVNNLIYLIKKKEYTLMDYYLLSHEMRHAWQNMTNPVFYFKDYYNNMSEYDYNNTEAEIDANAFACVAIAIAFNKVTTRKYTTDKIAEERYNKRLEELKKEFGVEF